MKNTKMINAFKAFEIENTKNVLGGKKTVMCTDGVQCDIYDDVKKEWTYDSMDKGLKLGETWGYAVNIASTLGA